MASVKRICGIYKIVGYILSEDPTYITNHNNARALIRKLEGLASRWAAEQITEEDAKSLRDILELQEFYTAKGDLDQLRNLDSQFHERIYEISGSRTLRQTLSSLHHSIQRYRKMSFATKGRAQKVMIEHQRIVDAIASHDPEAAEKATVDHIEMAATNMLKNLGLSSEEDVHADSAAL